MQGSMSRKCWLPVVCLAILPNCAKHKLTPLGATVPPSPAVTAPVAARPGASATKIAQPASKVTQAKAGPAEVNRLLQEPPRMSFSPDGHVVRKGVPKVDKITIVSTGNGASTGMHKLTGDMTEIAAQVPALFEALSGMPMADLWSKVRKLGDKTPGPGKSTGV